MHNPKLIRILKSLSPEEFKNFGKFIKSPAFNVSRRQVDLYNSFKRFFPAFDSPLYGREYLFKSMYGDQKYNDNKLRNQLSIMLRLAEEYLSFIEFKKDLFYHKTNLLTQLGKRDLMDIFTMELEHTAALLSGNSIKDEEYFLKLYLLEKIKRKSFESKMLIGKSRNLYENILFEVDCLSNFFLISVLKEYFRLDNAERLLNIGFRYKLFDFIIKYVGDNINEYKHVPYINVFSNFISKFKTNKNESSYKILKDIIRQNTDSMGKEDSKILYTELYNYCKSLESKNKNFGKESFDLINKMLSKGLLFESDGYMHVQTYINVAASAIRENELEWAEEFIINFKDKLHPDQRDNAFNYNYAVYLYKKGKNEPVNRNGHFDNSLKHLSKVRSEDCYYFTRIKNLQLILFYELENYEEALCLVDTYIHYLTRNKTLPKDINDRYSNFVRFLHRLINIRLQDNRDEIFLMERELKNNNNVEYRNWLLEKITGIGELVEK